MAMFSGRRPLSVRKKFVFSEKKWGPLLVWCIRPFRWQCVVDKARQCRWTDTWGTLKGRQGCLEWILIRILMSGSETCWDLGVSWLRLDHISASSASRMHHLFCARNRSEPLSIFIRMRKSRTGTKCVQGQCREKGVRVRPQARGEHRLREDRTQNPGDKQPVCGKGRNYFLIPFLIFID